MKILTNENGPRSERKREILKSGFLRSHMRVCACGRACLCVGRACVCGAHVFVCEWVGGQWVGLEPFLRLIDLITRSRGAGLLSRRAG